METPPNLNWLILARDEAESLSTSLPALVNAVRGTGEVHVVADHCQDRSAAVARQAGAVLHVRQTGEPGKGRALHWWLARTAPVDSDGWVVVLDADSRLGPGFVEKLVPSLSGASAAFQVRIDPIVASERPIPSMAALSEAVEQGFFDVLRRRLGWPVRLRGTGMVLRRSILERYAPRLHTVVEDAELSLLLYADGIQSEYLDRASVLDPKPARTSGAARQRARWLRGQGQILRDYPQTLLAVALRGLGGFSLIGSLMFKPRSLLFPLKVVLTAALGAFAAITGSGAAALAAWSGGFLVALETLIFLVGVISVEPRFRSLHTLLRSPLYIVLWVRSLRIALTSPDDWPRVRARPALQPAGEAGAMESGD